MQFGKANARVISGRNYGDTNALLKNIVFDRKR
jgi:hypothetical protein